MQKIFPPFLYGLLLLLTAGCNPEPVAPPSGDSITKADREILGERIAELILTDSAQYPILPNAGADTLVYNFVRQLYNQATTVIRTDIDSPAENRWQRDRLWPVSILSDDTAADAFTLPGGHLFITTGFLKSMEKEFELFYVLSFEANLIDGDYLRDRLIAEYNTVNLRNLINGAESSNGIGTRQVMQDITNFTFDSDISARIDELTVPSICRTSLYRPDGVSDIIADTGEYADLWLEKRISYGGRESRLLQLTEADGNCGSLRGNGAYEENVLNVLD